MSGGAISVLAGCPIYSDDDCSRGRGYDCFDSAGSSGSTPTTCSVSSDCGSGYVCTSAGRCVVASTGFASCTSARQCATGETCGRDAYCHAQDCTYVGCVQGTCLLSGGAARCVVLGDVPSDASAPTDACVPTDAGDASVSCPSPTDGGNGGDAGDAGSDASDGAAAH